MCFNSESLVFCCHIPGLEARSTWENDVALFVGLVLGVGIMFGMGKIVDHLEGDDDEDEDDNESGQNDIEKHIGGKNEKTSLLENSGSPKESAYDPTKIGVYYLFVCVCTCTCAVCACVRACKRIVLTKPFSTLKQRTHDRAIQLLKSLYSIISQLLCTDYPTSDLRLDVRVDLRKRFQVIMDSLKSLSLTNRDEVDEMIHRIQAFVHACKRQILHKQGADTVQVGPEEQAHFQRWVEHLLDSSQVHM